MVCFLACLVFNLHRNDFYTEWGLISSFLFPHFAIVALLAPNRCRTISSGRAYSTKRRSEREKLWKTNKKRNCYKVFYFLSFWCVCLTDRCGNTEPRCTRHSIVCARSLTLPLVHGGWVTWRDSWWPCFRAIVLRVGAFLFEKSGQITSGKWASGVCVLLFFPI